MASLSAARTGIVAPRASRQRVVRVVAVAEPPVKSPAESAWSPASWRQFPIVQQPQYPDETVYRNSLKQISSFPPLIFGEQPGA
jgi:hypothetical protein